MNTIKRLNYQAVKGFLSVLLLLTAVSVTHNASAMDQCNTTSQCKATYGAKATDCKNSKSNNSICICGSNRCDASGPAPKPPAPKPPTNPKPPAPKPPANPKPPAPGGDQCNTTAQCRATYGNSATDCKGSSSPNSVCICGSKRCDAGSNPPPKPPVNPNPPTNPPANPGGTRKLGKFTIGKDLMLSFFDNKPDADDIHSQAAAAAMLKDSRFKGMDHYAVLGTYGKQGPRVTYLNSTNVMKACFGNRWANAHPKDGANWNSALNTVLGRVNTALKRGGTVWVQEAGQSDFTADLVRRVKKANPGLAKNRIQVVQHSLFNERMTGNGELNYVKANTQYHKIPDGNGNGNGSPGFHTKDKSQWNKAVNNGKAGKCWKEARATADRLNPGSSYVNPAIKAGGMDFSDTVEFTWVTGFNGLKNHKDFFNTFPK